MNTPETKCAAITVLVKIVEMCSQQLNEKCEAAKLQQLRQAIQAVSVKKIKQDNHLFFDETHAD